LKIKKIGESAAEPRTEEGSTTKILQCVEQHNTEYKRKVIIMKQIVINNISTSYFITEDGKCYNSKTNKYLKGQENYKNHYFSYNLTMPDGSKKRCYAHRLVAEAFIPKPKDRNKKQINHKDGNKLNNTVENLEWVSAKENVYHSIQNELKKEKPVFCFNKDKRLVAKYKSVIEAGKAAKISTSLISQELNKEIKTLCGGFYWSREKVLEDTKDYTNLGKAKEVYQYDLSGRFINKYSSTGEAARSLGLNSGSHIGECCRGKIKQYKGFVWRYSEDIVSPSSES
jgi:hypothetical protein